MMGKRIHLTSCPLALLKSEAGEPLRTWLSDDSKKKQLFDQHRAQLVLAWQGIHLKGVDFDALLAAYLLDPTESNLSLSGLTGKYSLPGVKTDEEVFGKGAKFRLPELAALSDHLGRKAMAIARIVPVLREELEKSEMHQPLLRARAASRGRARGDGAARHRTGCRGA